MAKRGPKKGSHHRGITSAKTLTALRKKFIRDCNKLKRDGLRAFRKAKSHKF